MCVCRYLKSPQYEDIKPCYSVYTETLFVYILRNHYTDRLDHNPTELFGIRDSANLRRL